MFADPQSLTVDTASVSFPRTGTGVNEGRFLSANITPYDYSSAKLNLLIQHSYTKNRARSVARLDLAGIALNPLVNGNSLSEAISTYLVFDRPISPSGLSATADQVDYIKALLAWGSASTYAAVTKLVGGES